MAIERVRTNTWRHAYRGLMPDTLLDGLGYDATRRRALMSALPPHSSCSSRNRAAPSTRSTAACAQRTRQAAGEGEAEPYVLPEHQGRGIGRALLQAAAKELVDRGFLSMTIWVLRENAPSRQFYERLGGRWIRDEMRELDGVRITESGYWWEDIRPLARSASTA